MVMPLAAYLLKTTGQRRWLVSILLCALGSFATLSRTGIIMMIFRKIASFLWDPNVLALDVRMERAQALALTKAKFDELVREAQKDAEGDAPARRPR